MEHAVDLHAHLETPFKIEASAGSSWPRNCFLVRGNNLIGCDHVVVYPQLDYAHARHLATGAMIWIVDAEDICDGTNFLIAGRGFPQLISDVVAAPSPWKDEVDRLRRALGLPITGLVEALQVTRPTFYEWLRGEQPNRSNQARIRVLAEIARVWSSLNLGPMSRYWNLPMPSASADLRAVLTNSELSLEQFNTAVAHLGIGKRLLPARTSKPPGSAHAGGETKHRSRRKAWGTTPPNVD